jgi:hypothetical protein
MSKRKGRAVTTAERPIHNAMAEAMLAGRIWSWCVPERGTWEVWTTGPGAPSRLHSAACGAPDLVLSEAEAAAFVGLAPKAKAKATRAVFTVKAADLGDLPADLVVERLTAAMAELRAELARPAVVAA